MGKNFSYGLENIEKGDFLGFDRRPYIPPKFFYDNLNNEIKIYNHQDTESIYYDFFKKAFFRAEKEDVIIESINFKKLNEELKKENKYFAFYISENDIYLDDEKISMLLRGSKTLKINEKNSYDNTDVKIVFSERGFLFINKFGKDQENKFNNILTLYLLSHAYNLYSEGIMSETIYLHKRDKIKEMLELRKEVYSFNLTCFFSNPVKYDRPQLHQLWIYLHKIYFVEKKHLEVKSQMEDLINLVEIDEKEKARNRKDSLKLEEDRRYKEEKRLREEYRDKEEKKYREEMSRNESLKLEEERRYKEEKRLREKYRDEEERRHQELQHIREQENKQFNQKAEKLTKYALIIAVISLLSLIGAYKDFKDLKWDKAISKEYNKFMKMDKTKYISDLIANFSK